MPNTWDFTQRPSDHLLGKGCPHCGFQTSKAENEIYEFIANKLGEDNVLARVKNIIPPREIDIYIPSLKIGIEYNGVRWHSELFGKSKQYHLSKTEECNKLGIKLIQIFEDEWEYHKDIVLSKIEHILNISNNKERIMARKCTIIEIDGHISTPFLEKNHIQGPTQASIYLGAYYNGKLIGVMQFKEETKGSNKWDLNRFATDNDYICQGIGCKLFKYFVRKYNPHEIKSFADRRWTINNETNIYTKLGFKLDSTLKPDYRYIIGNDSTRHHKFGFRKNKLHKLYGLPLTMTETEMAKQLDFYRVWDCGLFKYVWKY